MKRVLVVALVVGAGMIPPAQAKVAFAAYGADASGTAVHLRSGTNSLSNFSNGFIDNAFPLAATHMDASPATTAAATVADTGPGGGFLDFEANGKLPQTQYALAGSPGAPSSTISAQGTVITAQATSTSADARAAVGTTTSGGPNAKESPAAPVNTDGDTGQSHVIFDGTSVKANSASSLAHVTLAGGLVAIDGLTVTASVVATATTVTTGYSVTAQAVKVAGVAVSVTDKGIAPLGPNPVPVQALNQALAQSGVSLRTVAPVITHNGINATVEATGITVSFTAPDPNPSVPSSISQVILGEARAFAFATVAGEVAPPPPPTVVNPPAPAPEVLALPPAVVSAPTVATTPAPPTVVAPPAATAPSTGLRLITTRGRPTALLWLYLLWQIIILANAGAVLWWRRTTRA
ncbi:MAG: hypothetical protein ACYDH6_01310 [Acidimicrobiales bacterium]